MVSDVDNGLGKPRMASKVDRFFKRSRKATDLAAELMKQIPLAAIPMASEDNGSGI